MEYILGLIAVLAGGLIYYRTKAKSAEALNENLDTKKEVIELSKDIAEKTGLLKAEEEKRKDIEESSDKAKEKGVSISELENFFNRNRDS